MLDNTQSKSSKFRIKNWFEINDELRGTYKGSNQIKFKTSMVRSNLYDWSDAYIFVSGTITIKEVGDKDAGKRADERNKGVIYRNCIPFTDFISNINVTQMANAKYIDVMMPMYSSTEYIDNYSKTLGGLRQYYRHESNDDTQNLNHSNPKLK